jgi:hypothetical protein
VIVTPILFSTPPLNYLKKRILSSFSDLVPYKSLISEEKITRKDILESRKYQIAAWGQIVLVAVGLSGVAIWSAIFGMNLLAAIGHDKSVVEVLLSAGMVFVWVSPPDCVRTSSHTSSTSLLSHFIELHRHLLGRLLSSILFLPSLVSLRSQ